MKKYVLLLCAILGFTVMCTPVSAIAQTYVSPTVQEGLEVVFTSGENNYTDQDPLQVTLTVKNTNNYAVSDVALNIQSPLGYQLFVDSYNSAYDSKLESGETIALTTIFEQIGTGADLPQTGDDSHAFLWLVMACVSALCLLTICRKQQKRVVSMLLSIMVFASVAMPIAETAAAMEKNFGVETTVEVAGRKVSIKASISFDVPDQEHDMGEISFAEPEPEHIVYDESKRVYYVDNQVLLTSVEDTPRALVEQMVASMGGRIVGAIEMTGDYQIAFAEPMTYGELEQLVADFASSSFIEHAALHELFAVDYCYVPNDQKWKNQQWSARLPGGINWGVEAIDAMGAWEYMDEMQVVNVGIIDAMFDADHQDLAFEKVWNNAEFEIYENESTYSHKAHGTHVAGTFAAKFNNRTGIAGVAPKTKLFAYSIQGDDTDGVILDPDKSLFSLLGDMEIKYALALLVTNGCRVINLSMGTTWSPTEEYYEILDVYVSRLRKLNFDFIIVQAAGNHEIDALENGFFVGCQENEDCIIVVGSVADNGTKIDKEWGIIGEEIFEGYVYSKFSNWGERVDIAAPGERIYSTVPGNKYEDQFTEWYEGKLGDFYWRGTSMAAPHVSGVAAMCYAVNPGLSAAQVKRIILDSAVTGAVVVLREEDTNQYSMLNAKAAVDLARTYSTNRPERPAKGTVMGQVFGQVFEYFPNVRIAAYQFDTVSSEYTYVAATENMLDSEYVFTLEPGQYTLLFSKDGYIDHFVTNVMVRSDEVTYLDDVFMIESNTAENGVISGQLRDAVTGQVLSGVQIAFYPGWGNSGYIPDVWQDRIVTSTTDSNGMYSAEIQQGAFTAVMNKDGYAQGTMNVISSQEQTKQYNGALSPLQVSEQYRIVLTWGETPDDLDSHLTGSLKNGDAVHVSYETMTSSLNGEKIADLDADDTSSYGPETITLYLPEEGSFCYSVHDYSNRNSATSNALGRSGAKVTVYKGSAIVASYPVPNVEGTAWHVFDLANGGITPVNAMSYVSDPDDVGRLSMPYVVKRSVPYHEDDKDYN